MGGDYIDHVFLMFKRDLGFELCYHVRIFECRCIRCIRVSTFRRNLSPLCTSILLGNWEVGHTSRKHLPELQLSVFNQIKW